MNDAAPPQEHPALARAGLLVVDKPAGMTSHDVVARCRRLLGTRKVGHAGTLDPMATGVLVLGVERATKLLGLLALTTKSYTATIRLGQSTVTDDAEGETVATTDATHVTDEQIGEGVAALTGDIQQVPASVSAIKIDGKRAYARMREGEAVELKARPVTVSRFDVLARRDVPGSGFVDVDVDVDCSSGTYIRALARDLGAALGVGGHLTALRRTRSARSASNMPARSNSSPTTRRRASTSTRPCARPSSAAPSATRRWGCSRTGRWLEPVGIHGVYGAVDAQGRAAALLQEKGKRAAAVFVVRPSNM